MPWVPLLLLHQQCQNRNRNNHHHPRRGLMLLPINDSARGNHSACLVIPARSTNLKVSEHHRLMTDLFMGIDGYVRLAEDAVAKSSNGASEAGGENNKEEE